MTATIALKKLSVRELKQLGYKLSDNQIPLGPKPYKFGILEVKNEDNNREVSFSLLYSVEEKLAQVLPQPYNFYLARPKACSALLR